MLRPWIASTLVALALSISLIALPGAATARPETSVVEFPLQHPDSRPYTIVTGPDGNLWFTESDRGSIGRITPTGTNTEFDLPYADSGPYGITLGADGNLWFTERFANLIGKITPQGVITEYYVPTENAQPWDITAMPDGSFWFTEENVDQVGMIDHLGNVMEVPTGQGQLPTNITTGPDGNVWFTEELGNNIVRFDPDSPYDQTDDRSSVRPLPSRAATSAGSLLRARSRSFRFRATRGCPGSPESQPAPRVTACGSPRMTRATSA